MTTARISFDFDKPKAIEAILYLANKITTPGKYKICKMLYLADKICLERYGRFIFGESYTAVLEGATPSIAYDLIKQIEQVHGGGLKIEGNAVIPLRQANLDYLSQSDKECLDQIITSYDNAPTKMREDAHDAAWKQAWEGRGNKRSTPIPVENIAGTLNEPHELIGYLTNQNAE